MDTDIQARMEALEKRVKALEGGTGTDTEKVLELDLTLPEAEIGGLFFNEQKVHGVFDLKEDGWYHSRDILFMSARNVTDDMSRDLLTEYLQSKEFISGIYIALVIRTEGREPGCSGIEVSLPVQNEGVKKYHGVNWHYWLNEKHDTSLFHAVGFSVHDIYHAAGAVCGCAPMFRLEGEREYLRRAWGKAMTRYQCKWKFAEERDRDGNE